MKAKLLELLGDLRMQPGVVGGISEGREVLRCLCYETVDSEQQATIWVQKLKGHIYVIKFMYSLPPACATFVAWWGKPAQWASVSGTPDC